jgi:uncharacterized protein YdiU (UPF0061 family)
VAASHIRVGTFEYFRVHNDREGLKILADYVIQRHYPMASSAENPYLTLLEMIMHAQASLVSSWLHIGFIHGVMNTDNMTVSGETIDYGPCAFMDMYDPSTVFSSIDREGRYAYGNQGPIALWNLTRLAECLLPLLDNGEDKSIKKAEAVLSEFSDIFNDYWLAGMGRKLGLARTSAQDEKLVTDFFHLMREGAADFTLAFRLLADCIGSTSEPFLALFNGGGQAINLWLDTWRVRLSEDARSADRVREAMQKVNPLYIPRNQNVEAVLQAAVEEGDYQPFEELLKVLSRPFDDQAGMERYAAIPPAGDMPYRTFCGT